MRRTLLRLTPVLLVVPLALAAGTGCRKSAARQEPTKALVVAVPSSLAPVPAPFAAPVITGTPDVATLVATVKPSVVNITTIHELRSHPAMGMGNDPFGYFNRRFGRGSGPRDQVMRQSSLGSGFLIDAEGHVVTNAHVVDGADEVHVKLADEREFDAKVVGRDARLDLAVLALQGAKDLPAASLGKSEQLRVGEYVVAIGNPFGLGHTVTMGIVSAKGRSIGAGPYDDFIQTDASINPGNSGGPLFDLQGRVVGINSAINPNGQGIGFAIPIDMLKDVLPQLLAKGHVDRGHLGVAFKPIDAKLARTLKLDKARGAYVADVERGSPADRAGLESGDVIVKVEGRDVTHAEELPRLIALHPPGTKLAIDVLREGKSRSFEVELGKLREPRARVDEDEPSD
jgi:serine protease Do